MFGRDATSAPADERRADDGETSSQTDSEGEASTTVDTGRRRALRLASGAGLFGSAVGTGAAAPIPGLGVTDARIVHVDVPTGRYATGGTVPVDVTVQNTGATTHTFFVGYSAIGPDGLAYTNDGTTGRPVTLTPGERETLTLTWVAESDTPAGPYDVHVVVWHESHRDALETKHDERRYHDVFRVDHSTDPDAVIDYASFHRGTYRTGEVVEVETMVTSGVDVRHTYFVGLSAIGPDGIAYTNDGSTGRPVTLGALETVPLVVSWTVEADAPRGHFDIHVAVWRESDRDALETKLDERRYHDAITVA